MGEGIRRDDALVAWLSSRGDDRDEEADDLGAVGGDGQDCPSYDDAIDDAFDALDVAFGALVDGVGR
jgi:hypothetical protein